MSWKSGKKSLPLHQYILVCIAICDFSEEKYENFTFRILYKRQFGNDWLKTKSFIYCQPTPQRILYDRFCPEYPYQILGKRWQSNIFLWL